MTEQRFGDFQSRFESSGTDPVEVIKLLVEAMLTLADDPDLGKQMMALVMSKRDLDQTPGTLSGYSLRRTNQVPQRLQRDANIARSYAGGTYQNDYRDCDPANPQIEIDTVYSAQRQGVDYPEEGKAKFFVKSGGADTPRPVVLARNRAGYWKVTEMSSLTLGVRPPAGAADDF